MAAEVAAFDGAAEVKPAGAAGGLEPALSLRDLGRTLGPTGKGSGLPTEVPSEWNIRGLHFGSSNIKDEFLKCSIIDTLPWILAYDIRQTFSELNFSHFLLSNSSWNAGMLFGSIKLMKAYPTLHLFLKSMGR